MEWQQEVTLSFTHPTGTSGIPNCIQIARQMYVIGTAGHVDHGKSTLVKALTGIDPDRLREEKERGLTIDLGFAWLRLPSGQEVSIIDVPGHERFISNMLAGVGGIDLVLLVVAADESIMPQTLEHLAILDLLQVKKGLVAITKKDLVQGDWLSLVAGDVRETLKDTVLEGCPIVEVSGTTGEGLDTLLATIDGLLEKTEPRKDLGRPRLPIDRSFTIAGFGTVVTGTLIDGSLRVGDEVELLPMGKISKVRSLQTHQQKLQVAQPGSRVAANIAGISQEEATRGSVLTTPGWLKPTNVVDVRLRVVRRASLPIKHNMSVSVHTGSSETPARIRLLEKDTLLPGESSFAQLKLEHSLAVVKGDGLIVRAGGITLGGGTILDTNPKRHTRGQRAMLDRLTALEQGSEGDVLFGLIESNEPADFSGLVTRANIDLPVAENALSSLVFEGKVVTLGTTSTGLLLYTSPGWQRVKDIADAFLRAYHQQLPLRRGAPKEELRSRLDMTAQVFVLVLPRMQAESVLSDDGAIVRSPQHQPALTNAQEIASRDYIRSLEATPYSPPTDMPIDPSILAFLMDEGKVVKVGDTVVFSTPIYNKMVQMIVGHIKQHGQITVADVRDMFGTSRKYAVALLEYLDQERVTRRTGDIRVLR